MSLTPHHLHALLLAERSRDVTTIETAVRDALDAGPGTTLSQIDQVFRDAGSPVYLIAGSGQKFWVVVRGLPALLSALKAARAGSEPASTGRPVVSGSETFAPSCETLPGDHFQFRRPPVRDLI
jgi:hypothetical protein